MLNTQLSLENNNLRQGLTEQENKLVDVEYRKNKKSVVVMFIIWLLFGIFGGHRFYVNKTLTSSIMFTALVAAVILSVVAATFDISMILLISNSMFVLLGLNWLKDIIYVKKFIGIYNLNIESKIVSLINEKNIFEEEQKYHQITGVSEVDDLLEKYKIQRKKMVATSIIVKDEHIVNEISEIFKTAHTIIEYAIKNDIQISRIKSLIKHDLVDICDMLVKYGELENIPLEVEETAEIMGDIRDRVKQKNIYFNKFLEDLCKTKIDTIDTDLKTQEFFDQK